MNALLNAVREDWRQRTWYGRLCYPMDALELLMFAVVAVVFGVLCIGGLYVKALNGDFRESPSKYKEDR